MYDETVSWLLTGQFMYHLLAQSTLSYVLRAMLAIIIWIKTLMKLIRRKIANRNVGRTKNSGGTSAVKESGHFEVRKSSRQVTRMHFFHHKKLIFLVVALKTQAAPTPFHRQNSDQIMVTFVLSVYSITEAKQYTGLGRVEPGLERGRWIFQRGHLTWRALV